MLLAQPVALAELRGPEALLLRETTGDSEELAEAEAAALPEAEAVTAPEAVAAALLEEEAEELAELLEEREGREEAEALPVEDALPESLRAAEEEAESRGEGDC